MKCSRCNGRGMLEIAHGIQYCMCPIGRTMKKEWLALPEELPPLVDRWGSPMPDSAEDRRARRYYEHVVPTLPDDDDLQIQQPNQVGADNDSRVTGEMVRPLEESKCSQCPHSRTDHILPPTTRTGAEISEGVEPGQNAKDLPLTKSCDGRLEAGCEAPQKSCQTYLGRWD
jgi:hypothetical protein